MNKISEISIEGLHDTQNYSINFSDNRMIIVGENGSCKTTIFRMIYFLLTRNWDSLASLPFEAITVKFLSDKKSQVLRRDLQTALEISRRHMPYMMHFLGRHLSGEDTVEHQQRSPISDVIKLSKTLSKSELERGHYARAFIDEKVLNDEAIQRLKNAQKAIEENFDATILYMPTYRRIEEPLEKIFPLLNKEDKENLRKKMDTNIAMELVEFGMGDVEKAISDYQTKIKEFLRTQQNELTLGYLNEIIDKKYAKTDIMKDVAKLPDDVIGDVLKRMDENILPKKQKDKITDMIAKMKEAEDTDVSVENKIIFQYFLELMDLDKRIREAEEPLLRFAETCNEYFTNKSMKYDNQNFGISINMHKENHSIANEQIKLQDLSSGEKQIASLFGLLNLNQDKNFFVLIDEPELSLSVKWQRRILVDIINSHNCVGLFAATHSPFIFDNELEPYVHGINEFLSED